MPNYNTEHLPCSADLSAADQAAEQFRAHTGTRQRLPVVPDEWAGRFTPQEWAAYQSERFHCWHSAAGMLSPEAYLNGTRLRDML
jgi:hypothetical protein